MTDSRVSAIVVETMTQPEADSRVTAISVETMTQPEADSRLGAIAIEVMCVMGIDYASQPESTMLW